MSEKSYARASNLHALTEAAKTYSKVAATYAVASKAYTAATGPKPRHSTPYPDCPEFTCQDGHEGASEASEASEAG
ncbi:hypothetical protein Cantr_07747 [Candida viswanathii]|uniref:Uncharacterized protein n=1 Tax=Candida viswanathii TaxID=5486 RepID=A0A367XZP5_9ASCO|nr:hypothetical protein Cantr_07747 [Candida viswanathii]